MIVIMNWVFYNYVGYNCYHKITNPNSLTYQQTEPFCKTNICFIKKAENISLFLCTDWFVILRIACVVCKLEYILFDVKFEIFVLNI